MSINTSAQLEKKSVISSTRPHFILHTTYCILHTTYYILHFILHTTYYIITK